MVPLLLLSIFFVFAFKEQTCDAWVGSLNMKHGASMTGEFSRRRMMDKFRRASVAASIVTIATGMPRSADAENTKSRSEGYVVQKSEAQWEATLTQRQYEILREGGTERPHTSVLEWEDRPGTFFCAGCGTALFESDAKFHSGTGWPSFATALDGVEVEETNALQATLGGSELRCKTCGGHLGDVFKDGWIFQGTPAAISGKRFCIDGSALVFKPSDGSDPVIGDTYPDKPSWPKLS